MNQKQVKNLRRTFEVKKHEVLLKIREHYGTKTENIETIGALWRNFKRMYKEGKIEENFIIRKGE